MIQAMKVGRTVGVRGRPPKLTSAQKAEIEEKALKRSTTPVPMTSADINALVFCLSFLIISSLTLYRQMIFIAQVQRENELVNSSLGPMGIFSLNGRILSP